VSDLLLVLVIMGAATLIGVAVAWSSWLRPLGIVVEGWRQTANLLRRRSPLPLYVFGFLGAQRLAPLLIASRPAAAPWVAVVLLVLIKALVVYALAHVAYRLHRGLIYGEWDRGLTWGERERRMALYVLFAWTIATIVGNLPIPAPPSVPQLLVTPFALGLAIATFVLKTFLALTGPAASLDDPAPLRQSVKSIFREPVGIFCLVASIALMMEILKQVFGLALRASSAVTLLHGAVVGLSLLAEALVFIVAEFALVIALTRTWEDVYEPETRSAAHNLNWL